MNVKCEFVFRYSKCKVQFGSEAWKEIILQGVLVDVVFCPCI